MRVERFVVTAADAYAPEERARGQRDMITEGAFVRAMEGVTGGVILAGFALALGASEFEIGLIAAIPFLAQLAHVPTVLLLNRYPDRRRVVVAAGVAARLVLLVMALVPFLEWPFRPVLALVPLLVVYASITTVSGGAWQVWIRDLVPREEMGRYFGKRLAILSGAGLVTLLLAGQFITWWQDRNPQDGATAFAVLFVVGSALGLVSSVITTRVPFHAVPHPVSSRFLDSLKRPFRHANYRRVLVFLGAWGFAANFAVPFIAVVLIRDLGYAFTVITALAALSALANIAALRVLAPLTDRFANKPVLGLSALAFILTMLVWAVVPKTPGLLTLVAAAGVHALLGAATAGLDVASNGVILKLADDAEAPAFLASASVVRAVATGTAPLLGGVLATLLTGNAFAMRFTWTYPGGEAVATVLRFAHTDFLFLLSALFGLYAVHRLLGFEETGDAPRREVLRAARREVLTVSSIAGVRQFAHLASFAAETAYEFPARVKRGVTRSVTTSARRKDRGGDVARDLD